MLSASPIVDAESPPGEAPSPPRKKNQQLKLFMLGGAWEGRFESLFFRGIPQSPGVYFFRDAEGKLLYIGQSHNLRDRIGSYRHVSIERHPTRTCRLVSRVRHIAWELCESAPAAIQREKELLLEHRPRFNRAGVWQAPPWWLTVEPLAENRWRLALVKDPADESSGTRHGPFPSSFPYVWAALVRVLWRECHPTHSMLEWPAGLHHPRRVSETHLPIPTEKAECLTYLQSYLESVSDQLILISQKQQQTATSASAFERSLWEADIEMLRDFFTRRGGILTQPEQSDIKKDSPLAE